MCESEMRTLEDLACRITLKSEAVLRRVGLRLLEGAARLVSASRRLRHGESAGTKEVLILEPFGMGDVLALEPLVRVLASNGWGVHICAQDVWRAIIPPSNIRTWTDCHVPWKSYSLKEKYRIRLLTGERLRQMMHSLRSHAGDCVGLDPRGDIRSILLLYLAGCRHVITLSHYLGTDIELKISDARIIRMRYDLSKWRLNLLFLEPMGVKVEKLGQPSLAHLRSHPESAVDQEAVAFIPMAPWPGKLWGWDKWRDLHRRMTAIGKSPIAFCGPGQKKRVMLELGGIMDVRECDSVQQWIDSLERVSSVIGVDTGPTHIADALGKPLVMLMGPGRLPLWGPTGIHSRVVHHQDRVACAPCHHSVFRCRPVCMQSIEVEEVLATYMQVADLRRFRDRSSLPVEGR